MGRIYVTFRVHPEAFPIGDRISLKKARPSFRPSSALSCLVCSAGTNSVVGKIASWLHPRPDIHRRMAGTTGGSEKQAQTGELEGVDGSRDRQEDDPKERDFEHNATLERRGSNHISLVGSARQHSSPESTQRMQMTLPESVDCCVLFMRSTSIVATGTHLVHDAWYFSVDIYI